MRITTVNDLIHFALMFLFLFFFFDSFPRARAHTQGSPALIHLLTRPVSSPAVRLRLLTRFLEAVSAAAAAADDARTCTLSSSTPTSTPSSSDDKKEREAVAAKVVKVPSVDFEVKDPRGHSVATLLSLTAGSGGAADEVLRLLRQHGWEDGARASTSACSIM